MQRGFRSAAATFYGTVGHSGRYDPRRRSDQTPSHSPSAVVAAYRSTEGLRHQGFSNRPTEALMAWISSTQFASFKLPSVCRVFEPDRHLGILPVDDAGRLLNFLQHTQNGHRRQSRPSVGTRRLRFSKMTAPPRRRRCNSVISSRDGVFSAPFSPRVDPRVFCAAALVAPRLLPRLRFQVRRRALLPQLLRGSRRGTSASFEARCHLLPYIYPPWAPGVS